MTPAGKRLLESMGSASWDKRGILHIDTTGPGDEVRQGVAAIEAEAVASERARIAELLVVVGKWEQFYSEIEDYGPDESPGMVQWDHGFAEYASRISVMVALRALLRSGAGASDD